MPTKKTKVTAQQLARQKREEDAKKKLRSKKKPVKKNEMWDNGGGDMEPVTDEER